LPGVLQEPFRWIGDVALMDAFESGVLDLPDFYLRKNALACKTMRVYKPVIERITRKR
jgi:hypothetical protein